MAGEEHRQQRLSRCVRAVLAFLGSAKGSVPETPSTQPLLGNPHCILAGWEFGEVLFGRSLFTLL